MLSILHNLLPSPV